MAERLSFLLTAVLGILGWLVTYYVERVTHSPTVQYGVYQSGNATAYTLLNVSRAESFGPITVTLTTTEATKILGSDIEPVEPADEDLDASPDETEHSVQFTLNRLLPGGQIAFAVRTDANERPRLYLRSANQAVRFTQGGFETWLVRNETAVVLSLILIWAGILLFLVVMSFRGLLATRSEKE
jgi:hypothetical protein